MSWFGGGGGSKNDSNSGSSYQPESSYQDQGFVGQQESYAAPRSGGGTSTESFQQELIMEQQKALIQAVMFKLTETAFQKCVTSPSTSLSSSKISQNLWHFYELLLSARWSATSTIFNTFLYIFTPGETSCIKAVTSKFLDTSELIVGRLSQQQN